jgi:ABC-type cobalamin/Fe3+-siderophores transport system ATPase subunit
VSNVRRLLEADAVTFSYGQSPVLRGVDVRLDAGEVVGLIGPNGSGKSTLIKVLLGQLRAGGKVQWEGKELNVWRGRELAKRVAYLPQSPTWDVEHRVKDVLRLGRAPYWSAFGIESSRAGEVVERVARQLGLIELMGRRMDELSGGQRQRVFVGRCLVQEPVAMLLDEPNTFLDIRHQVEMGALLKRLAKENQVGVLMASHDLNLAGAITDRMMLLSEGRVMASGNPDEVLRAEFLSAAYGVAMERVDRGRGAAPVVVPVVEDMLS